MSVEVRYLDHDEILRLLKLADPCATIYCGIVTIDLTAIAAVCRALLAGQRQGIVFPVEDRPDLRPTKETP